MSERVSNLALGSGIGLQGSPQSLRPVSRTGAGSSDVASKATEFEAILLGQWLQGSETAFGDVPGGDAEDDAGADQVKSFAFQHLASGLAEKGGIGIAEMVRRAMSNEVKASSSTGAVQTTAGAEQAPEAQRSLRRYSEHHLHTNEGDDDGWK